MLKWRVFSAVIGVIILGFFVIWGSLPFYIFVNILAIVSLREFTDMIPQHLRIKPWLLTVLTLSVMGYIYFTSLPPGLIFLLSVIILIIYIMYDTGYEKFGQKLGINLVALLYIGGGFLFFILLRDYHLPPLAGTKALWLALITTWAADTGAYFLGKSLGRRSLAGRISPNKTIMGALGGIIAAVPAVIGITLLFNVYSLWWPVFAVLITVISIVGDLFESCLKRNAGLKDSGNLLPGHGGLLDRFDGLLLALPVAYYFYLLIV